MALKTFKSYLINRRFFKALLSIDNLSKFFINRISVDTIEARCINDDEKAFYHKIYESSCFVDISHFFPGKDLFYSQKLYKSFSRFKIPLKGHLFLLFFSPFTRPVESESSYIHKIPVPKKSFFPLKACKDSSICLLYLLKIFY